MLTLRSFMAIAFLFLVMPAVAQDFSGIAGPNVFIGPDGQISVPLIKVIGNAVKTPSIVRWKPDLRVSDALVICGGLTLPPEEVTARIIAPQAQGIMPINLAALLNITDAKQNFLLAPGDILMFSAVDRRGLSISGAVARPGYYFVSKDGVTLSALLLLAGGPRPDAALSHVQVVHENQIKTYDMRPLPDNQGQAPLVVAGDTILVQMRGRFTIVGAVARPGEYLLPDGELLTVAQALQMAGGLTPDADGANANISLSHLSGNRLSESVPVGMQDLLKPGDNLTVPSKNTPKMRTRPEDGKARLQLIAAKSGARHD